MTSIRAKQIRFISILSLIAAFMASTNACLMIFFYGQTFFSYFGFFVSLLFLICYYLNTKNQDFFAKTIILLLFNFAILNISSTQGKGSGSILLFFPLASLYFLLFEAKQWIWILFWFSILGVIGLEMSGYSLIPFSAEPVKDKDQLFLVNFSLASLGQILIMSVFMKVSRELESGLQSNLTEKEFALEQLREAKDLAEQAAEARSLFLSSMSHEIRTPLNSILGFTNLLADEDESEAQKEMIQLIQFSSKNLLSIINDILEFNKWEAGKVSTELNTVHLRNLLTKIQNSFSHITKEKQINLDIQIGKNVPILIQADETKLIQVLYNLVSNAIKFTEQGSVIVCVNSEYEDEFQVRLKFEIIDTGIGIAKENLESIFEQFQQADKSISRRYGGTGLGLSIVKRILEYFDSKIEVKSQLGSGTTFFFTLQFSKTKENATLMDDGDNQRNNILSFQSPILVVDDNELNLTVVSRFLAKWKIPYLTANTGTLALELLQKQNVSVVVMDLQMPEMDGFQTTKKIRETNPDIPIVALTADTTEVDQVRLWDLGFTGLLHKPFLPEDLNRILRTFQ